MRNLLRIWRFLLLSIVAWAIALGMFVLVRRVGAPPALKWSPSGVELLWLWATVAEVGVVKRDIAYLSDVLNTAARLESMCREHGAELLITETLKEALPKADDLGCKPIGELELRGKAERISVYRVEPC